MSIHDRGFASMSLAQRKAIASLGGKAAHAIGRAHQWTSQEAQDAGRKGGRASQVARQGKREAACAGRTA